MKSRTLTSSFSSLVLVFVIGLCFSLSNSANPTNFLKRGSYLSVEKDLDMLTSSDNTFTCGFYLVGENAYYFSIGFTNSKDKTVAWMANRDEPVNGKGSKISLHLDGAFVLTNVDGSITWETNTRTQDVQRAELLDNGNLVLMDSSDKVLWQSFDFPTNTLLPHQLFTKNKKLISMLGRGNYGTGYFNFIFDTDNVLRLIYDGPDISSVYWPNVDNDAFGNGRTNFNSSRIAILDETGWFSSSDLLNFNGSDSSSRIKRRLTIDHDGNLRLYSLNIRSGLWTITWEAVMQLCTVHGLCGRNGICINTPQPKCSCPPGYEMTDARNWNKGCKPKFSRICTSKSPQHVKFVKMQHVDFYGFDSSFSMGISLESCKMKCLEDCECNAFSYRLTGEGMCFTKRELFNGYKSPNFPGIIYLKLPLSVETSGAVILNGTSYTCKPSESTIRIGFNSSSVSGTKGKNTRWVYLYSFASVIGAIEFLFFVSGWWFLFTKHGVPAAVEEGYRVLSNHFRRYSYMELKKATKNFKYELGRGASGVVFKGILPDERVVAVKKLEDSYLTEEVFWAEVSIIGKINHMNLVRMWGFCLEPKRRLLVYEHETELTRFNKVVKGKLEDEEIGWVDTVDTRLNGQFSRIQAKKMIEIGMSCVDENRSKRPAMDYIVQALLECEDQV